MSPDSSFLDKIDPQLQEKLAYAPENEILRVIVRLSGENQSNINSQSITPADFPNRTEYRKALIAQRQQQLVGDIGATKKAIENLDLKTYGGINTKTLVVEGTVNQILHSLELSGIDSATLDRSFITISPNAKSASNNSLESIFLEIAEKSNIISTTRINRLARFLKESDFNSEENTKQLIIQASQQYIANYHERYGLLKVLGMRNTIKLESICTNVKLLKESKSCFKSIEELENSYRKNNVQFHNIDLSTRKDIDIANQEQYLMVLGSPGSGKSTFLRKVALEAISEKKQDYQHKCVPVLLELGQFSSSDLDIKKNIIEEFKNNGFFRVTKLVTTALKEGKLLILLDGLDEIHYNNRHSVIDTIQKFVKNYNKNRFIISCRIAAYQNRFNHFTYVEIADFDNIQIKQYIDNWFDSELDKQEKIAANFWYLIQQAEYKAVKELARTPLLLTLLCLIYQDSATLPSNPALLYSKVFETLLSRWDASKRIRRDNVYQQLTIRRQENLLSEIAYYNFVQNKQFFTKKEIIKQIESFLTSKLHDLQNINGEAILNAISVQQGILVEKAHSVYSFSHLALQDYLTAQYIVDHNLIENIVSNNLTDTRWQEVFQLVAGLMRGGADELLLLMEKEVRRYLSNSLGKTHFLPLLDWSNAITEKDSADSYITPTARRVIALKYALGVSKNYLGYYCDNLDNLTNQYVKNNLYVDLNSDNDFSNKDENVKKKTFISALKLVNAFATGYLSLYGTIETLAEENSSELSTIIFNTINLKHDNFDKGVLIEVEQACLKYFIEYSKRFQIQSIGKQIFPDVDFYLLEEQFKQCKGYLSIQQKQNDSFSQKEIYGISIEFVNKLSEIWFNALQLTPDLINLSKKDIEDIDSKYFYINSLILKCKEAATRVSKETWEDIESRMLLPIKNTD